METYLSSAFAANNLSGWVAALFTFAAVVAALYVAGAAARRENTRAKSAAALIAARVSPMLSHDARNMAQIAASIGVQQGKLPRPPGERLADIAVGLRQLTFVPDDATLLALAPLEKGCAHKISRAYGIANMLASELKANTWSFNDADDSALNRWEGAFVEASHLLLDASETCQRRGHVVAMELPSVGRTSKK